MHAGVGDGRSLILVEICEISEQHTFCYSGHSLAEATVTPIINLENKQNLILFSYQLVFIRRLSASSGSMEPIGWPGLERTELPKDSEWTVSSKKMR